MAGPCASVMISRQLLNNDEEIIKKYFQTNYDYFDVPTTPDMDEELCSINPKSGHFIICKGWFDGEFEECSNEFSELTKYTGWVPKDQLTFIAMCNNPESHLLLAKLCLYWARYYNGIVDFNGWISYYTTDISILNCNGRFSVNQSSPDYLTPDYLQKWIDHKDFKMVK